MTLAFYGVEGLSKGYLNKPIDIGHFEKGLQFLERHPSVSKDHIGVLGTSKGGDLPFQWRHIFHKLKLFVY